MLSFFEWKQNLGHHIDPVEDEWFHKIYIEVVRSADSNCAVIRRKRIQPYLAFLVQRLQIRGKAIGFCISKAHDLASYFQLRDVVVEQEILFKKIESMRIDAEFLGCDFQTIHPPYTAKDVQTMSSLIDRFRTKRKDTLGLITRAEIVGYNIQDVSLLLNDQQYRDDVKEEVRIRENVWMHWSEVEHDISSILKLDCSFAEERKLTFYHEGPTTNLPFFHEQLSLAKAIREIFPQDLPHWVLAEIQFPLCMEWLASVRTRLDFDRKWRAELGEVQQQIHPKFHDDLPQLPSLITQHNICVLVEQFRRIRMGFYNQFWLWVQGFALSYG